MCVGIEVEVVVPAPQAAPRIPASEDLGALALFHSYAATVGMSQPALDAALDLLRVSMHYLLLSWLSVPLHPALCSSLCLRVCWSQGRYLDWDCTQDWLDHGWF